MLLVSRLSHGINNDQGSVKDIYQATIVIPTYRKPDHLNATLSSLRHQTVPSSEFEVIVVHDGLDLCPGYKDVARQCWPFKFKLVAVPHCGRASARNVGISQAKGEVLIFIDDDCVAGERFVQEHLQAHSSESHCFASGWAYSASPS